MTCYLSQNDKNVTYYVKKKAIIVIILTFVNTCFSCYYWDLVNNCKKYNY